MKTNLTDLMSRVSKLEKESSELQYDLQFNCMNTSIIELNGHTEIIEENSDFDDKFNKLLKTQKEIIKLKTIISKKNNELQLSNGNTIAETIIELQNKRQTLRLMKELSSKKSYKKRTTETNNSYFTNRELAYDKKDMEKSYEFLNEDIQHLELELSQINAEMFEIDD